MNIIHKIYNYILKFKFSTKYVNDYQVVENRVKKSLFFMLILNGSYLLVLVCMVAFHDKILSRDSFVNIMFVYCVFTTFAGIIYLPYHPRFYGLNLNEWKFNLFWGGFIGIFTISISILLRYQLVAQGKIEWRFNPNQGAEYLLYPFSSLFQEIVVRGYLQSYFISLFRSQKNYKLLSILFSSVIFALYHLMFGFFVSIISFFYSIFLGYFYERTRSILGVTIIHFFTGTGLFYFSYL